MCAVPYTDQKVAVIFRTDSEVIQRGLQKKEPCKNFCKQKRDA